MLFATKFLNASICAPKQVRALLDVGPLEQQTKENYMLEGLFSSLVTKAVMSVAAAFGLFGGLAVTGVLPVLGDQASSNVVVDAIALVETPDEILAVNPVLELPSVDGVASQLPLVDDLTETLPNLDGITASSTSADSGLPVLSLAGTLLNSLTGTVETVLATLPVANRVVPSLPVGGVVGLPTRSPEAIPGLDLVDQTLSSLPGTVGSVSSGSGVGNLGSTARQLPLVDELLRTARVAIYSVLPDVELIVL
jgi:hypothetical protein